MNYQIELTKHTYGYTAVVIDGEHRAAVRKVMKTKRGALAQAAKLIREFENFRLDNKNH